MKKKHQALAQYVDDLQRNGRYSFTKAEAAKELCVRNDALTKSLQRLSRARRVCQVQRGFYAVVPIEYSSSGAPPVDWFIHDLMEYIGQSYYVGVLTAAMIHGAAHQRPQEYHVVSSASHRTIHGRGFRIRFFKYAHVNNVETEERQTYTGYIPVSRPEGAALDLVRFNRRIGGLDAVLTVFSELGENIDSERLLSAAKVEEVRAVLQRTGWLLDRAGWGHRTALLHEWLSQRNPVRIPLNSALPNRRGSLCSKWHVIENDQPESDL